MPSWPASLTPLPALRRRSARSSRRGPGSGTTGGAWPCTGAPPSWSTSTAGACPPTSPPCSPSRGSARTPLEPSWPSRASRTSPSSTPTWPGSSPVRPVVGCARPKPRPWPTPRCPRAGVGAGTRPCSISARASAGPRAPRCEACPVHHSCAWRGGPGSDPAVGSAGRVRSQSRFEGSDRQGRGRLVDALRRGPVADVATAAGWPEDPERAERVARTLVADGLAVRHGDTLALP